MRTTLNPRQRTGRLLAALAMLITPLAAVTVLTAGPASAATCSGSHCNYTDPQNTGCWDSSAYIVKQETTVYGSTLRLWYSGDCKTNWAQIYSPSTVTTYLWTELQNGTQTAHYKFQYIGWAWSDQLYAPTTNARACEQEYYISTKQWGPIVCVGQY
jgi:hypothetical protein